MVWAAAALSYMQSMHQLEENKEQEIENIARALVNGHNDPFDELDEIIKERDIDQNTKLLNLVNTLCKEVYTLTHFTYDAFIKTHYPEICTAIRKLIDNVQ